eukprot:g2166.t1
MQQQQQSFRREGGVSMEAASGDQSRVFGHIYDLFSEFAHSENKSTPQLTSKVRALLYRHADQFLYPYGKHGVDSLDPSSAGPATKRSDSSGVIDQMVGRTTIHKDSPPVSRLDVIAAKDLVKQLNMDEVECLHAFLAAKMRIHQLKPELDILGIMSQDQFAYNLSQNAMRERPEIAAIINKINSAITMIQKNARLYYANERQHIFWMISDLMKTRHRFLISPDVTQEKKNVIMGFTNDLLKRDLPLHLMGTLNALLKRQYDLGHRQLTDVSLELLGESFMFIYASTQATEREVRGLLRLIKATVEKIQVKQRQSRPVRYEKVLASLFCALLYALDFDDASLLGDGNGDGERPGGPSAHLSARFYAELGSILSEFRTLGPGFKSIVFLAFGLHHFQRAKRASDTRVQKESRTTAKKILDDARDNGSCRFLGALIRGPCSSYQDADSLLYATAKIRSALLQYFEFLTQDERGYDESPVSRLVTREELMRRAKREGVNLTSYSESDTLEDLMEAYASSLLLRPLDEPVCPIDNETEHEDTIACHAVRQIIIHAMDKLSHSYGHYNAILDFLTAIATGGPRAAYSVYVMVGRTEFKDCNFKHFFQTMLRASNSLSSPNEPTTTGSASWDGDENRDDSMKRMSEENELTFQAIFRLVTAVLQSPHVAAELYNTPVKLPDSSNQGLNLLRVLFDFLNCTLEPATRAGIVRVITMFAKCHVDCCLDIYDQLEGRELLGLSRSVGHRSLAGGCDLLRELKMNESLNKKYDLTTAVLRLLVALAPHIPLQLGAQYRPPGWYPYLEYVTTHVFADCMKRQYQPGPRWAEKWEVAALCLAVMRELLKSYDVHSNHFARDFLGVVGEVSSANVGKSAGFRLMFGLLSKGEGLLQEVVGVLTSHGVEGLEFADGVDSTSKQFFTTGDYAASGSASKHKPSSMPKNDEEVEIWWSGAGCWTKATFEKYDANKAYFRVPGTTQAVTMPKWALGIRVKRQSRWKSWHRRACQAALGVLELLVLKQRTFLDNCRQHLDKKDSIYRIEKLALLHKLLSKDQVISIAEYVRFGNDPSCSIPRLSARVLFFLISDSFEPLADSLFREDTRRLKLINGYAMRLREGLYGYVPGVPKPQTDPTLRGVFGETENDSAHGGAGEASEGGKETPLNRRRDDLPRTIVELLLSNLNNRTLNLSQLFLGFKERTSVISEVGTRRYHPKARLVFDPTLDETPLHVICNALLAPDTALTMPSLAEGCYQLIYELCRRQDTSFTTCRFLRTSFGRHFFAEQLGHLPLLSATAASYSNTDVEKSCALLNVSAWILKCAALEIHLAVRSTPQRLDIAEMLLRQMFPWLETERDDDESAGTKFGRSSVNREQARMGVFEVLDKTASVQKAPLLPPEISRIVRGAGARFVEERTYGGHKFGRLDIVALFRELRFGSIVQLEPKKIQTMLSAALQWNHIEQLVAAQQHLLNSWKQVVVLAFLDGFPQLERNRRCGPRIELLVQLIQSALLKIRLHPNARSGISEPLAEAALMSFHMLREKTRSGQHQLSMNQLGTLLHHLLATLTQCDGNANSSSHELRGSLYSALLIFVKLVGSSTGTTDEVEEAELEELTTAAAAKVSNFALATIDSTLQRDRNRERQFLAVVQNALRSSGERMMRLVARDSAVGMPVWQAISLATIDALLARDRSGRFLEIIRVTGHLQRIVTLVGELPKSVLDNFATMSDRAKAEERMHIYDKAMTLLIRIAQTRKGSTLLLQSDVLSAVSSCEALLREPSSSVARTESATWLVSSPTASFRRILNPALRLILSLLLSSANTESSPGQLKILKILLERASVVLWCLREATSIGVTVTSPDDEKLSDDAAAARVLNDEEHLDVMTLAHLASAILAHASRHSQLFKSRIGDLSCGRYEQAMKRLLRHLFNLTNAAPARVSLSSESEHTVGRLYMMKLKVLRNVVTFCRHQSISSSTMSTAVGKREPYFDAPTTRDSDLATLGDVIECAKCCMRRSVVLFNIAERQSRKNVGDLLEERRIVIYLVENLLSIVYLHFEIYRNTASPFQRHVPKQLGMLLDSMGPLLKKIRPCDRRRGYLAVLAHQMRLVLRA